MSDSISLFFYFIDKCAEPPDKALVFVRQIVENGWSRNMLLNFLDAVYVWWHSLRKCRDGFCTIIIIATIDKWVCFIYKQNTIFSLTFIILVKLVSLSTSAFTDDNPIRLCNKIPRLTNILSNGKSFCFNVTSVLWNHINAIRSSVCLFPSYIKRLSEIYIKFVWKAICSILVT